MKKLTSLSVFFPCLNEAGNLPGLIKQALEVMPGVANQFELIIIDDGSSDQTGAVAQELADKYPQVKLVAHAKNLGYGAALQTGFNQAQFEWIFFTDGDHQFDLSEITELVKHTPEFELVAGYRRQRAEGFRREVYAKLLSLFAALVFRLHLKDVDCAFKLVKADLVKPLSLFSNGAFISTELLYKLKKQGVEFNQVAVSHYSRKHGCPTGNKPLVMLRGMRDALKLYLQIKFDKTSYN